MEFEYSGHVDEELMICAGKTGKGSCKQDTGGPLLVQNKNGSWFQYGITALFGMSCGHDKHPGIYARVSAFCDFVSKTTNGTVNCQNPDTY
uniref:Peptidase S1 domain-containing protein n=1 Tax=Panagrolaimus sp. JU765 TaxID=591449 RepID=A0AC34Q902_9BILA